MLTLNSRKLWWTHGGEPTLQTVFPTQNEWHRPDGRSQFDMKATSDGWQQLFISDDRQSFWIQQVCLESLHMNRQWRFDNSAFPDLYTRPLFHGMNAVNNSWCKRFALRPQTYTSVHHLETNSVYPVHYRVECISDASNESRHRYIVRLHVAQQKWVHQCLIIRLVPNVDLLWMSQSQSFSFEADQALCDERNTFDSIIWIPALTENRLSVSYNCPFSGGFQITSITELPGRKSYCDYQSFATLESDCVADEGMEWSFDQPGCNPFEPSQVTRLICLQAWSFADINFVLLHDKRDISGPKTYSLVYDGIPENLNPLETKYQKPRHMWISAGLKLPAWLMEQKQRDGGTIRNQDQWWTQLMGQKQESFTFSKVFEFGIRRAFGHCDDERLTCDQGCDSDARNRMFCYRTCRSDDNKCDSPQWDSCQFESAYQGDWDLLVRTTSRNVGSNQGLDSVSQRQLRLSIFGKQVRLLRYSKTSNESAIFQCIRKVGETISDWFVIRTIDQHNGCRPRDLCLELYQSGLKRSVADRDTNTMLYRLSSSQRQGTDAMALCRFESRSRHKQNIMVPSKLLVKRTGLQQPLQPGYIRTVKCGLYQMRLSGTMLVNAEELLLLTGNTTYATKVSEPPYRLSQQKEWQQRMPHFQSKSFQNMEPADQPIPSYSHNRHPRHPRPVEINRSYMQHHFRKPVHCTVALTDFNRSFGVTGEFDDLLRIQSTCSEEAASFLLNRSHQCISSYKLDHTISQEISYRMIVTYNPVLRDYLCWIFKVGTGVDRKQWVVFVFASPQCQYSQTVTGNILVMDEQALAKMDLKIVPCHNCHQDDGTQKPFNAEPIISPVPHHPTRISSVPSTKGRQALRSPLRQPGSANFVRSMRSGNAWYNVILAVVVFHGFWIM
ncbi:hypothetical protein CSKR_111244 [Clonorchis sinensis]|uniref:Uncharacterized protein n=1 Tax=Clonorchis sinensis TaxID=79923 RepID=A0A8T1MSF2_CLOSI|nr:hypothetical protein CSKR_111244 [Clonorchis sinensis]